MSENSITSVNLQREQYNYEQVHANKLDNLMSTHQDEIDKYLERHTFPKLAEKEQKI